MGGSSPSVSIILPTYNRGDILRSSIQSVLNQTYSDFELIIVDDGSTDNTEDVVRDIEDHRVKYLSLETNRGAPVARNAGIDEARGDIIAFQDSDDVWYPEKLQKQIDVFRNASSDVGVVYTGMWRTVNGNSRYLPYSGVDQKQGDISESITNMNFISTQMAAVRRECFDTVGGFDEELSTLSDWELWMRIAQHYRFRLVDEPLVDAKVQADSISNNRGKIVQAREGIIEKHSEIFNSGNLSRNYFYIGHGAMKQGWSEKGTEYLHKAVHCNFRPIYLFAWVLSFLGPNVYNFVYRLFKAQRS